jgi:tetratricopeptide (TPR) repeat protein
MADFARKEQVAKALVILVLACCGFTCSAFGEEHRLDEMSLERWAKLRETERYQLQIAEKYFREQKWKVAIGEYEKYLTLYERSEAAPYAQLKWSAAHVQIRKANTAIKDGYQSVIDYWPDSHEAVAAAYYIGNTYRNIGQITKAKRIYRELIADHPKHTASVYAMVDLVTIASQQKDDKTRVDFLKKLTFEVPRGKFTGKQCADASRGLATWFFQAAAFDDALKSLATSYPEDKLPAQIVAHALSPISSLVSKSETKAKGERLADLAIAHLRKVTPTDIADDDAKNRARRHWFLIADVQAASQRDALVPKVYDEIIKKYGSTDELLGRLATWHKSKKKYEQARSVYRRYENKIEGLSEVALSYRQERKFDLAISTYNQLLGQDRGNSLRWKSQIAAAYREIPKYPEAIGMYTELLSEDIEHAQTWRLQIATAHRDAGQLKEAIGHFRQCTNFPENYKQMARCHRQLKQYNEALLLYNQIAGGHESSAPWAVLQIGYTREEAGQKEAAIRAFQQVCKRFPKDGHASAAHAHLQNKYKLSITLGGAKDE